MNADISQARAKTRGLSLFPNHEAIVDRAAALRGLQGNTFSPAIQFIITDWAAMRGLTPPLPAIADLSDGALTTYPPQSSRVNVLRDTPLMTLIEEGDLPEAVGESDEDITDVYRALPPRIAGEDDPPTL